MNVDIHVHSICSDGAAKPEEIIAQAKKIGLDAIAITDHNKIDCALKAAKLSSDDFKVIPGIEVSAIEGHILCLNIEEEIPRGLSAEETIERCHELGGIAIAAHPFDAIRGGVSDLVFELDFDAIELYNGRCLLTKVNLKDIYKKLKAMNKIIVAGSDAHTLEELGTFFIRTDSDNIIEDILSGKFEILGKQNRLRIIKNIVENKIKRLVEK